MPADSFLDAFNAAEPERAERQLLACCASRRWADELLARRPYHDVATMQRLSDTVFAELPWSEIEQALAAHPRIGERPAGGGQEAEWSHAEQSGVTAASAEDGGLTSANAEYERRFGHVFLICATGLSTDDILAALRTRLANDERAERAVVREELRKIAALRLRKLAGS
jgi:2-oxo-4-hydroxy-4-carboxy-5-ureidoimidazoline decarboxylase